MDIEILEESDTKIVVKFNAEDHTFVNPLKEELWNDSHIKVSAYRTGHSLADKPELTVETDGKESPRDALQSAVKRLKKDFGNFKKAFEK